MKIQLIKAPTKNTGMPEHDWYTPLNLIWLANYLIPHSYEVEILDGQLISLNEIKDRINADIVGVSFDILSITEFEQIISEAKRRNCHTITGGHLATALGSTLLERNIDLDAVVSFDGEDALLGFIESIRRFGKPTSSIPNLMYKTKGRLVCTNNNEVDLRQLPLPRRDVGGINIEAYIKNYQNTKKIELEF